MSLNWILIIDAPSVSIRLLHLLGDGALRACLRAPRHRR
jgi:hypothetical protein